jgi:TnpA family transposase
MAELVEHWTVLGDEKDLVSGKRGATRLGFALVLKFYTLHGRFPRGRAEFPHEVVDHVARQIDVPADEFAAYEWSGSTFGYHKKQIRDHLGFKECSVAIADKLTEWLAVNVAHAERDPQTVREELLKKLREECVEPPTPGRLDELVTAALHAAERTWFATVPARLTDEGRARVLALVGWQGDPSSPADPEPGPVDATDETEDDPRESVLALIRSMPGNVSLESLRTEKRKLLAARGVGLPPRLFADVAPKVLAGWRGRCAVESPSHLRRRSADAACTLLAAYVHERTREITDELTELLIATVHRIDARAQKRVTEELVNAFKRVDGKENLLFKIAEAALSEPSGVVERVVYPAVRGGEQTLKELVHEYKTKGPVYRRTVQTTLKASYTNHYRSGLIDLLDVLEFRSVRSDHPLLAALEVIRRHAKSGTVYYPLGETVPEHRGVQGDWAALVYRSDQHGNRRVVRQAYEIATFRALREQLLCKEVWVIGAGRYRDPNDDLPKDFESRRSDYYRELRKPLNPGAFCDALRVEMTAALATLNDAIPELDWLEIAQRKAGPIKLTPLDAAPEPRNLRRIRHEVARRWAGVPLVDFLKEAVLRSGALDQVVSVTGSSALRPEVLAERLILAIYAYGTNTGIHAVAPPDGAHTEEDVRYVRRRYLTLPVAQAIAIAIANATFAARDEGVWGTPSTSVASDSTHFRAWDQNLFTEWHARYGGRGILVYWHVEEKHVVVHSQVIKASASEVAAMVEGAVRHGTTMKLEGNYTDTHGQSLVGFGITRLLEIDLLPRIKQINAVRLYRPEPAAGGDPYPRLAPALHGPINWRVIEENYDTVVKYATAIHERTASTEAVLSRFRNSASHPAYQAMLEIGKAQRTIFVARYLHDRDLQRQIESGLNVVEAWNRANAVICYGKSGEISSNRREEVEMTALCLRILQASLVYVNTLMLQEVLGEPGWAGMLTPTDRRGLTPLFWEHVRPYGEVRLDLGSRLSIGRAPQTR